MKFIPSDLTYSDLLLEQIKNPVPCLIAIVIALVVMVLFAGISPEKKGQLVVIPMVMFAMMFGFVTILATSSYTNGFFKMNEFYQINGSAKVKDVTKVYRNESNSNTYKEVEFIHNNESYYVRRPMSENIQEGDTITIHTGDKSAFIDEDNELRTIDSNILQLTTAHLTHMDVKTH